MANTAKDMPAQNRSASEIDFVLRQAKWRKGADVLRDMARTESEPMPVSKEKKSGSPAAHSRSKIII